MPKRAYLVRYAIRQQMEAVVFGANATEARRNFKQGVRIADSWNTFEDRKLGVQSVRHLPADELEGVLGREVAGAQGAEQ